ncbi:MAG: xanthine dehydrogenase family protein subunit M [Proteobacteria bacterium]|nr:xanthine dehydrogenase family protein subunit M [Pseudomonadota bacterium]MBU4381951.1 xanthine dehydrogenase family protein subunit M [Pseudomonadota bacterium]MCG2765571.1 xanthine dehydrogenase family protein subunit M [Desulfarculaceae bacterium]
MAMPQFQVHQPKTLESVLDLLGRHRSSVKLLCGGTDLLIKMRAGAQAPEHLVSLNRVAGLKTISYAGGDGLVIGGAARISQVGKNAEVRRLYPGLAHACSVMATVQIRNMGTVAGNLVNAAPSADTAAPLLAYGASVVAVERGGRRQIKLVDFFTGPGLTVLEPGEMVEAIRVPDVSPRSGSCYLRLSARSKVDIAAVSVAGFLNLDLEGRVIRCRLALGSVGPTPLRCPEAEQILEGQTPDEKLIAQAAAACVRASRPIDDLRATAAYRRAMVQVLAQRVLTQSLDMAKGGTP